VHLASNALQAFYHVAWNDWGDMIRYSPGPRIRREKILSWVSEAKVNSLLDIGCGNSEFLLQVHAKIPSFELAGADISHSVIEENKRRLPGVDFFTLDLDQEHLPRRFDAVTCMEVVEHCQDYRAAIKRLAEMTGKWLFITVPCGPLFEIDRRVGHTKHFSAREITDALQESGLKVITAQRWGFPFFNLYKHAINLNPDVLCKAFLSSQKYRPKQKLVALLTYAAFKASFPWLGYQLFVS